MSFDYKRWKTERYNTANDTLKSANACRRGIFLIRAIWVTVGAIALLAAGVLVFAFLGGRAAFVVLDDTSDDSKPSATIEEFGRYSFKGQFHTKANPKSSGGVDIDQEEDVTLLEQTDQIPCQVGVTWGFRILSSDLPANRPCTVRQETSHPPIRQPDGSVLTKSIHEFESPPGDADQFYGWRFLAGYEYELVPGEWTIAVFIDDVEVARKTFHIRK